jgi:hypothetical protein
MKIEDLKKNTLYIIHSRGLPVYFFVLESLSLYVKFWCLKYREHENVWIIFKSIQTDIGFNTNDISNSHEVDNRYYKDMIMTLFECVVEFRD